MDLRAMEVLTNIKDGYFVEAGAFDGEFLSNTLVFEMKLNWTGLLVEPEPHNFATLQAKRRHAWLFKGALSPSKDMERMHFAGDGPIGGLKEKDGFEVMCAPLEMLLAKMGRKTVDFWSLDVEGAEETILANTNFDHIEVGVLVMEVNKMKNVNATIQTLEGHGFKPVGTVGRPGRIEDYFLVNPKYFEARGLPVPTRI